MLFRSPSQTWPCSGEDWTARAVTPTSWIFSTSPPDCGPRLRLALLDIPWPPRPSQTWPCLGEGFRVRALTPPMSWIFSFPAACPDFSSTAPEVASVVPLDLSAPPRLRHRPLPAPAAAFVPKAPATPRPALPAPIIHVMGHAARPTACLALQDPSILEARPPSAARYVAQARSTPASAPTHRHPARHAA